jgi:hypothetical protein
VTTLPREAEGSTETIPAPPPVAAARVTEAAVWAIALALAAAWLAVHGRPTRDADSLLYSRISAELSVRPVQRWIAPEWPAGSYGNGYFREHPAGLFIPAAVAARLGYPAHQSAFAVNLVYQALTLVVLVRLAATLAPEVNAQALAWMLQLMPLAFAYRVRANHEQPVVLCLAAALLGLEYARRDARWSLLTVAGLVGLLLVKGVLAAPAFLVCVGWIALRRSGRGPCIALGASAAAAVVMIGAYEAAYRHVTGESFMGTYLLRQVPSRFTNPLPLLGTLGYGLTWYSARLLWFPFPWSLAALAALPLARPRRAPDAGGWIAVASIAIYLVLFSLWERRAERYLFPAYYAVGVAGALVALHRFPRLAALAARIDRWGPWPAPLLFLALFAVHLAGGWLHLPTIKVWAPDSHL